MRRVVSRILLLTVMIGSLGIVSATSALADCGIATVHFCAWRDSQYEDTQLLHSGAPAGTNNVDVANDAVSSGKNGTNNHWCGMTNVPLLPPGLEFDFAPNTNVGYVGDSANDQIDWFKVRLADC
jgi:hypothetical protein